MHSVWAFIIRLDSCSDAHARAHTHAHMYVTKALYILPMHDLQYCILVNATIKVVLVTLLAKLKSF